VGAIVAVAVSTAAGCCWLHSQLRHGPPHPRTRGSGIHPLAALYSAAAVSKVHSALHSALHLPAR
jgi:hypothetical protein